MTLLCTIAASGVDVTTAGGMTSGVGQRTLNARPTKWQEGKFLLSHRSSHLDDFRLSSTENSQLSIPGLLVGKEHEQLALL